MLGLNQSLVQYKKYVVPQDPLEKEARVEDMVATNRFKRQRAIEYYQKLLVGASETPARYPLDFLSTPQIGGEPEFRSAWKHAITVKLNELLNGTIDTRIDDEYVEEFHRWLLGKSKYNVDKKKTPWGPRMLVGETIIAYIREFIGKKKDFEKKLVQLKITGPPMTIEHAWLYFKYIVTEADPDGSEYLPEWNWWLDPDPNKTGNNRYIRFGPNFIDEQRIIRDGPPNAGAPGPQPPLRGEDNLFQVNNNEPNVVQPLVVPPVAAAEAAARADPANVVAPPPPPPPPAARRQPAEEDRARLLRDLDNERLRADINRNAPPAPAPAPIIPPEPAYPPPPAPGPAQRRRLVIPPEPGPAPAPPPTERQMEEARTVVNAHAPAPMPPLPEVPPAPAPAPEPEETEEERLRDPEYRKRQENIHYFTKGQRISLAPAPRRGNRPAVVTAAPPPAPGPAGPPPRPGPVIFDISEEENAAEDARLRAEGVLAPERTPEQAARRASENRNLETFGAYNEVAKGAVELEKGAQNVNKLMKEFNDNKVRSGENPIIRTENQIEVNMNNLAALGKSSAFVDMRNILELGEYDKNLWTQLRGMMDDISILETQSGYERSSQQRARLAEIVKEENDLLQKTIKFMATYRNIHNDVRVGTQEAKVLEDFKKDFRKLNPLLISHLKVLRAQQFEISEHMQKQNRKKGKETERQASIKSRHKETIKKLEKKNKDLFSTKKKFADAIKKGEDWKESFIKEFNENAEDYNNLTVENEASLKAQSEHFLKKAEEEQKLMQDQRRIIRIHENARLEEHKKNQALENENEAKNRQIAAADNEINRLRKEMEDQSKITHENIAALSKAEETAADLRNELEISRAFKESDRLKREEEAKSREKQMRTSLEIIGQEFIKRFQPEHPVPFQYRSFEEFIENLRTFPIPVPGPPAPINDVINNLVTTTIEAHDENRNVNPKERLTVRKSRVSLKEEDIIDLKEARKQTRERKEEQKEKREEQIRRLRHQGEEAEEEIEEEERREEKEERKMEKSVERFQMEEDAYEEMEREEREQEEAEHTLRFELARAARIERKKLKALDVAALEHAEREREAGFAAARAARIERKRQKAKEKAETKEMKLAAHKINVREAAREMESEEKKKLREESYARIREKEEFERIQERKDLILEEYADVLTPKERTKIYTGRISEKLLEKLEKRKKKKNEVVSAFEEAMAIPSERK